MVLCQVMELSGLCTRFLKISAASGKCSLCKPANRLASHCAASAAHSFTGSPVLNACCTQSHAFSISVVSLQMRTWQNLQGGVLSLKEVKLQPSSLSSPNASLACATSMHSKDQSIIYIIDNCINSTDACSTKVTWPDCVPESPQAGVQGDAQSGPDMHPTQHQCRKLEPAQER